MHATHKYKDKKFKSKEPKESKIDSEALKSIYNDPFSHMLKEIAKKIRNSEKKELRLLDVKKKSSEGLPIEEDQKKALKNLPALTQGIKNYKEIKNFIEETQTKYIEGEKFIKEQRKVIEDAKLEELKQVWMEEMLEEQMKVAQNDEVDSESEQEFIENEDPVEEENETSVHDMETNTPTVNLENKSSMANDSDRVDIADCEILINIQILLSVLSRHPHPETLLEGAELSEEDTSNLVGMSCMLDVDIYKDRSIGESTGRVWNNIKNFLQKSDMQASECKNVITYKQLFELASKIASDNKRGGSEYNLVSSMNRAYVAITTFDSVETSNNPVVNKHLPTVPEADGEEIDEEDQNSLTDEQTIDQKPTQIEISNIHHSNIKSSPEKIVTTANNSNLQNRLINHFNRHEEETDNVLAHHDIAIKNQHFINNQHEHEFQKSPIEHEYMIKSNQVGNFSTHQSPNINMTDNFNNPDNTDISNLINSSNKSPQNEIEFENEQIPEMNNNIYNSLEVSTGQGIMDRFGGENMEGNFKIESEVNIEKLNIEGNGEKVNESGWNKFEDDIEAQIQHNSQTNESKEPIIDDTAEQTNLTNDFIVNNETAPLQDHIQNSQNIQNSQRQEHLTIQPIQIEPPKQQVKRNPINPWGNIDNNHSKHYVSKPEPVIKDTKLDQENDNPEILQNKDKNYENKQNKYREPREFRDGRDNRDNRNRRNYNNRNYNNKFENNERNDRQNGFRNDNRRQFRDREGGNKYQNRNGRVNGYNDRDQQDYRRNEKPGNSGDDRRQNRNYNQYNNRMNN